MGSFKRLMQILMIITLAASVMACSKKNEKSSMRRSQRSGSGVIGPAPGVHTKAPTNSGEWGEIFNFQRSALAQFLRMNQNEFGEVSSMSGGQTGVRFHGYVDDYGRGTLQMYVFDSHALQGAGPITGPEFNCEGHSQNGGQLVLVCSDNSGELALVGYEQSNLFRGQVYFDGNNSLGEFRISACGFFDCY